MILDRINAGMSAWLEHKSDRDCLELVNKWLLLKYPDEPAISMYTLRDDRRRGMDLRREAVVEGAEKHLAEIDYAIEQTWRAFRDSRSQSLNRSAFITAVKGLIELKAKIDRTMSPDGQVFVHMQQGLSVLKGHLEMAMKDAKLTPKQQSTLMTALAQRMRDQ